MNNSDRYEMASTDRLKVGPNIRKSCNPIEQSGLVANMRENDAIIPLEVILNELGELEILDGQRRFLAAKTLGISKLPIRIREKKLSPAERMQQQLSIQTHRSACNPIEYAHAIADFIAVTGCTQSEAATKIGISNTMVSRCLKRLTLPEWFQELVEQGKVRSSTADAIAAVEDLDRQAELARRAAEGKLTRDEAVIQAKQPYVARPIVVDTSISEEIAEEQSSQDSKQASPEKSSPRRFSARLTSGMVTITSDTLEPQSVIGILTELLAKARKLSARGVTGDLFFKSLRESIKPT